ncbi:MAG: ABC transporter ATP-binding protein/permease [Clostridia bacterium]|nr:ABC transporter ATP-binding protein/permease [Clostridia bacterium]
MDVERREKTKDFSKNPLKIFLMYFGRHKGLFILDMLCAVVIAGIDIAFPYISRLSMYELLPNKLYQTFFTVMAIVVIAFALKAFLQFVVTYIGHMFGIRVEADIRRDLFSHFQRLGFEFYDNNIVGQLMNRLTGDLFEITELAHHGPEDLLISVVTIIGALAIMFSIEWRLALVVALIIPVLVLVVMSQRRNMMDASRKVKEKMADINGEIESGLSGMKTSQAFVNEDMDFNKFNEANDRYKHSKDNFYKQMGLFFAGQEFFVCLLQVAVIAVGGYLIMGDKLNYIDLITFSLYISTFISPIRKLANFAELFVSGSAGLIRFVELMRTEPSITVKENAVKLHNDKLEDLDIENVHFSYKDDNEILRGINLHVDKGETIAIVGSSGGGKTTLCHLIPRFYDVSSGAIKIDGLDIRDVDLESLRDNIGIVQQDVFLFADTIMENIRYGRPGASDEEVIDAAKKAELYDDIMNMPEGFETYVGQRGTLLSGGQKQRVAIARTILKNPPILILDEATSALDSVTEAKIQRAFDNLSVGRTTLVIAHRLSTIKNASRIIVIEDGAIQEMGNHEELLALDGIYAKLYKVQNHVRN